MSGKSVPPPNHTQTPNVFFDEILSEIDTMSELKVTLAIIRQTFGWHKDADFVSLSQLEEMTGMNRQQVVAGCKAALARGYVWREKNGGRNQFGLNVTGDGGGYDRHTPTENGGMTIIPVASMKNIPTKETEKESVEANASSAIAQTPEEEEPVIGLEKHIVNGIYREMKAAGYRLPKQTPKGESVFGFHLGRAKDMLEKDEPSDAEIEAIPQTFVDLWTIKGWADAQAALMELRRQRKRPELVKAGAPSWEPVNPHSPKPPMDPEKLAKEKARREEVARMLRSVS